MKFDITHLDKKMVIQTLFAHAAPLGLGQCEYDFRNKLGDTVDGLPDDECEYILYDFNKLDKGNIRLLDYHKGKPMKLNFDKKSNGRILVETDGYDSRNGKYRFFEAFLNIFTLDEILITKKDYRPYTLDSMPKHLIRTKEQESVFKFIIKHTIAKENKYGKYWAIDETQVTYTPPFML